MATTRTISRAVLSHGEALYRFQHVSRSSPLLHNAFLSSLRHASTKSSKTPLAKPDKFRPPSHPSRLVKSKPIPQYGPALTKEQKYDHATKQYPHMPPPKGSRMDKFLNNRALHTGIALSVLAFFALWTLILNFKATSPYAGQMPGIGDWIWHPFRSARQGWETTRLHVMHETAVTEEKRQRMISETMKTKAYRVMHGLEPLKGQPIEVQILVAKMKGEYIDGQPVALEDAPEPPKRRPPKKWLGIWE